MLEVFNASESTCTAVVPFGDDGQGSPSSVGYHPRLTILEVIGPTCCAGTEHVCSDFKANCGTCPGGCLLHGACQKGMMDVVCKSSSGLQCEAEVTGPVLTLFA